MNYSKPEVKTLGQAKNVIESSQLIKSPRQVTELATGKQCAAAYDLDE